MSRRYMDPDLWTKLYGTKSSTKLVACYLQVSAHNPAGIFRVRPEEIAMNTGLKMVDVVHGLLELNETGVVLWDRDESMVFLVGYAEVQGLNPKVCRSIISELTRLGRSALTIRAAQIPQLKAQEPDAWHRLSVAYGEGIHTLQSVCLSSEGESEGEKRVQVKLEARKEPRFVKLILDTMREEWPRGEDGRLYRFDRAKARSELKKIPADDFPTRDVVVEGVRRWKRAWASNGFQHNASRFVTDRLWEQSPTGKRTRSEQITAPSLIKGEEP